MRTKLTQSEIAIGHRRILHDRPPLWANRIDRRPMFK
jgi:hypothetical protein